MSIAKQIQFVNMVPAYNNGVNNFPFQGDITFDYKFKAWNVKVTWAVENYMGSGATSEALSGFRRSNARGYRMNVTLTLDNSTEGSKLRSLFNKMASGFNRTVWELVSADYPQTGSTIQLESGTGQPAVADYFNNLTLYDNAGLSGTGVRIIDYTSGGPIQLATSISVSNLQFLYAVADPRFPSIVLFDIHGTASTYNDPDFIPCNISNMEWLLSRDWTIHTQPIVIQLESINLYSQIPDDYRVA